MGLLKRVLRGFLALLGRLPFGGVRLPTDPIPEWWKSYVPSTVRHTSNLSPAQLERLFRLMQLFLKEIPFEGVGFEVTEEARVSVAAQACLLLLGLPYPRYTNVRRVLVYPGTFTPRRVERARDFAIAEPQQGDPTLGEAWDNGVVVLSWAAVQHGANDHTDGRNLVLHEFSHMLDFEDGSADGRPLLDSTTASRDWDRIFERLFQAHVSRTEAGQESVIDEYGATNRAEFFATAVEAFFERSAELRRDEPELYELLVAFFAQDTAGS